MYIRSKFFLVAFLLLLSAGLSAQTAAEIVYAEGEGFTLVREGTTTYYDLYLEPAEGLTLQGGDLLLTESGTWLELQIGGSMTLIKVAENTTFTLKSLQDEGGIFKVSYGRVRARVEKLTGETPFWIEGSDTVAGVRGTDFGYDLFYDEKSPEKKNVSVYCFDGKVEVVRRLEPEEDKPFVPGPDFEKGKEKTSTVILGRNEMVSVFSEDKTAPLDKKRIEPEVRDFWEVNEFLYVPPEPEVQPLTFEVFHSDAVLLRKGALYSSLMGTALISTGAVNYLLTDSWSTALGFTYIGSSLLAAGGYFLIRSFVIQGR